MQRSIAKLTCQVETSPKPISLADLNGERISMNTGNEMLDKFQPYCFGLAFSCIFSYCTAMPDPQVFMRRPRHRRTDEAPRVEISDWVRIMARRCEA